MQGTRRGCTEDAKCSHLGHDNVVPPTKEDLSFWGTLRSKEIEKLREPRSN